MQKPWLGRRALIAAGLSMTAWPALAQEAVQDPEPRIAEGDRYDRGVVEVYLNDRGPYRFAVDTAASASVIASDLIGPLDLRPGGELDMHTVVGLERVQLVRARMIRSGSIAAANARLAVGDRRGLLGLDGLIGLDLLADQRLTMRFRGGHRAAISRSRIDNDSFLGAVRPRVRFEPLRDGSNVRLMIVEVIVRGQHAAAIVDTGAQVSLINPALARAAGARPLVLRSADAGRSIQSPTGRSAAAEPMAVDAVHFDSLVLDRLAVLSGDFHIFRHLGFTDIPAMLLGVDVLGVFEKVAIDLKRGEMVMEL